MSSDDLDARLRLAMFAHLDRVSADHPDGIPSEAVNSFVFDGQPLRLIVQPGIRKPAMLTAALTIRTTYSPDPRDAPYDDGFGPDGAMRYKWRGTDPDHPDNRALREARQRGVPLAYFKGLARGIYHAMYPVLLVDEDRARHEFTVDIFDGPYALGGTALTLDRRYSHRLTRQRLHQAVFRPRVLRAYESRCALCRLKHVSLLDAAHILPDRHERGDAIVPNGVAMCKIHHAAYDVNIVGIRPDHVVEVRRDILAEIDGPMLRHGLQEMHGIEISLPKARHDHPDPSRLEERYAQFRAAA
jgi:putative restriction endonuclease